MARNQDRDDDLDDGPADRPTRNDDRGGRRRRDRDEPDDDRDVIVIDVDEPDDDDDDSDDDDADDARPPAKRKTAAEKLAELQAELTRKDRALRRARRDARRARNDGRRPPAPAGRRDRDDADDDDRDTPRRVRRDADRDDDQPTAAEKRQLGRARAEVAQAKGEAALMRAGADPSLAALAASKLSAGDVDWSDRDDVAGWVDEMRDEYPALFGKRSRTDRDDDGDDDDDDRPAPRRRRASVDQAAGSAPRRRTDAPKATVGQLAVQRGRAFDQAVQRTSRRNR
jgi:hypothetical protein